MTLGLERVILNFEGQLPIAKGWLWELDSKGKTVGSNG